jgi:hypothetical protein
MQTLLMLDQKNAKLNKGQKKFVNLKKEVQEMWTVLEHNYNIT